MIGRWKNGKFGKVRRRKKKERKKERNQIEMDRKEKIMNMKVK